MCDMLKLPMTGLPVTRQCEKCGEDFESLRQRQKFCGPKCRAEHDKEQWYKVNPPKGMATATTGTVSELVVAVDLLRRGFSVFRAMSPACNCDLAVLSDGRLCRVEVKTAYITKSGELTHPTVDCSRFDVLALVRGDLISYRPSITEWFETS
jgi:hypothetical protein